MSGVRIFRLVLLVANAGIAAESREPVNSAPNSIEAARREIEALKRERAVGQPPASASLPELSAPAMPALESTMRPSAPIPLRPDTNRAKDARAKRNWLTEGGLDNKSSRKDRGTLERGQETELEEATLERDQITSEQASGSEKPSESESRPIEVVNPLDAFMASWLSPRDHALLQNASELSGKGPGMAGWITPEALAPTALAGLPELSVSGKAPAVTDVAENPYLQGFDSSLLSPLTLNPKSPGALELSASANIFSPAGPAAPAPAIMLPPPAEKPSAREIFKPADEKKYFPRQNRF